VSGYPASCTTSYYNESTQAVDVPLFANPFGKPLTPTGQETIEELEDMFFTFSPPKSYVPIVFHKP
jgi:hypothetical protein